MLISGDLGLFMSFRLVMPVNALSGSCKSTETESKNMQIKCYATELVVMVTRCQDKVNHSFPSDCFDKS